MDEDRDGFKTKLVKTKTINPKTETSSAKTNTKTNNLKDLDQCEDQMFQDQDQDRFLNIYLKHQQQRK